MDLATLNEILAFVEADYRAMNVIVESGQRKVYEATSASNVGRFVLKTCPLQPVLVARIKREIGLLSELNSNFFPKFYFQYFVTDEVLRYFIDNLDPKTQETRIAEVEKMGIKPFLITIEEFIEHVTWQDAHQSISGEKELVNFLIQLFSGLALLWEKKIVHRDLKPENILIRPDHTPVIIDLGIAKSLGDGATDLTHPLFPSPCTPRYAAPEQLTNNKTEVTYKTDQFSVGVIAFLVVTGRYPYGSDAEIGVESVVKNFFDGKMDNVRNGGSTISEPFAVFIERLLKVQPYQRFRTTDEILSALKAINKEGL
jgi:serine/threonine-protein kinase